jgi:hypothetical protein
MLTVIGQGYVGLPLAMLGVEAGHRVVGLDVDTSRVELARRGRSYVDDVPDAQLRAALDSGRYVASTDYADAAGFDVAVITVPTPLRNRTPDLSFVTRAARELSRFVTPGSLVVLESTTYPGTTEDLVQPILEQGSGLRAGQARGSAARFAWRPGQHRRPARPRRRPVRGASPGRDNRRPGTRSGRGGRTDRPRWHRLRAAGARGAVGPRLPKPAVWPAGRESVAVP